jgi:hypothetical protein
VVQFQPSCWKCWRNSATTDRNAEKWPPFGPLRQGLATTHKPRIRNHLERLPRDSDWKYRSRTGSPCGRRPSASDCTPIKRNALRVPDSGGFASVRCGFDRWKQRNSPPGCCRMPVTFDALQAHRILHPTSNRTPCASGISLPPLIVQV